MQKLHRIRPRVAPGHHPEPRGDPVHPRLGHHIARQHGKRGLQRRQIGVLADRRGRIDHVMVGDDRRIFIPELERGGAARLRELRLIHTHLKKEPLSEEDLFDLTLLRLDTVTAITVDQRGLPEYF